MTRTEALEKLVEETEREHAERKAKWEADVAEYGEDHLAWLKPNPSSLFVWELHIVASEPRMGSTQRWEWTRLYVTQGAAERGACEEIIKSFGDWSSFQEKYKKMLAEGKYSEVLEDYGNKFSERTFRIRCVEVVAP
jgi:hypothetical protein